MLGRTYAAEELKEKLLNKQELTSSEVESLINCYYEGDYSCLNHVDEVEGEDDMIDFDIDEFDEKSFDELGERYLKKVYENVNSFKCTNVSTKKDKLIVEGKVNFASGKVSPTRFVFEACSATKDGRVSFVGHNKNITRGNKAFTLNGVVKDKNLIAESFKYNYMSKNPEGKSSRIYGTIKKI